MNLFERLRTAAGDAWEAVGGALPGLQILAVAALAALAFLARRLRRERRARDEQAENFRSWLRRQVPAETADRHDPRSLVELQRAVEDELRQSRAAHRRSRSAADRAAGNAVTRLALHRSALAAARAALAEATCGDIGALRSYVPFDTIDSCLAVWDAALAGADEVTAALERLVTDEAGAAFDRVLATEVALATFPGATMPERLVGERLSDVVARMRVLLVDHGILVDRPKLLVPVAVASSGFNAETTPGDRNATAFLPAAGPLVAAAVAGAPDPTVYAVAVERFGLRIAGGLWRTTLIARYNPAEWAGLRIEP